MLKALTQAKLALKHNEVPVGAVVVDKHGNVIARAYNQIEKQHCQCAHAEALAIRKACKKIDGWRLNGCWLYVTLEPCLMCMGLIQLSRLEGVIYGAQSPLFGVSLYNEAKLPPYAKDIHIEGGIKEHESKLLLQRFFSNVRQKRKVSSETENRSTRKNKK
jgi:tRNA(adenine34) deaminase